MDNAEEILRGLRTSDPHAWEEFHAHFWRPVLAVLSRKFPDLMYADVARDVTSDTLMAVVTQVRHGTDVHPDALNHYVMQVAQRKGMMAVLKRRRELLEADFAPDEELETPSKRPDPEQALRLSRKSQLMREALAQLKASDREILQRFYYDGQTKEQIMAAYAITHDQFRLRKTRALTKLMAQVYGKSSIANAETGTSYTRRELKALVGPCPH